MFLIFYNIKLFAMFVEVHVKSTILAAMNSIQKHSCIKFEETQLAPSNILTCRAHKFAVIFSNLGKRYVLSNTSWRIIFCITL